MTDHPVTLLKTVLTIIALALPVAGPARADFAAGVAAYDAKNYAQAFAEWMPLARNGDPAAERNIGHLYRHGYGVERNPEEAVRWYRLAAEKGLARAQANIASMYLSGEGVEQNYGEAATWFYRAARQGHAIAQYNLGQMYRYGLGVKRDTARAMAWYNLAAKAGYKKALDQLSALVLEGAPPKAVEGPAPTAPPVAEQPASTRAAQVQHDTGPPSSGPTEESGVSAPAGPGPLPKGATAPIVAVAASVLPPPPIVDKDTAEQEPTPVSSPNGKSGGNEAESDKPSLFARIFGLGQPPQPPVNVEAEGLVIAARPSAPADGRDMTRETHKSAPDPATVTAASSAVEPPKERGFFARLFGDGDDREAAHETSPRLREDGAADPSDRTGEDVRKSTQADERTPSKTDKSTSRIEAVTIAALPPPQPPAAAARPVDHEAPDVKTDRNQPKTAPPSVIVSRPATGPMEAGAKRVLVAKQASAGNPVDTAAQGKKGFFTASMSIEWDSVLKKAAEAKKMTAPIPVEPQPSNAEASDKKGSEADSGSLANPPRELQRRLIDPIEAGLLAYRAHDYATAVAHWLPLANAGRTRAQFYMGGLYHDGTGVNRDLVQAYVWWTLSADRGYLPAQAARDRLSPTLLDAQLAAAKAQIKAWQPVN